MFQNVVQNLPQDLLLQRLIDYKLRKSSKKLLSQRFENSERNNIKSLKQTRSKKELGRQPFYSQDNQWNIGRSVSPSQKPQVVNEKQRNYSSSPDRSPNNQEAQFVYQELFNLTECLEKQNDFQRSFDTIMKTFTNLLQHFIRQLHVISSDQSSRLICSASINMINQIEQKWSEQKPQFQENLENLSIQNHHLKLMIKQHSSMLVKLRSQFDELQKQFNESKKEQNDIENQSTSPKTNLTQYHQNIQEVNKFESESERIQRNPKNDKANVVRQLKIGTNLEDIRVGQNFQEEFMSKFDEFSLSWRKAAMQLKH